MSEEEAIKASDRKSASVKSAKPENGTFAMRSNSTELHALPAYSMFLRIYPCTNNFALVTRR
ncbi:hypothetical protein BWGOE4_55100 [Bacillus mycoides]|nr:hypothetical protein BWGOE4_55100 [Bacillus mycoides]